MQRAKINGKDLKIQGKSGPFAVRLFTTAEVIGMGEMAKDGLGEQYRDITQMALVYEKSGRQVYQPKDKDKMDKQVGGGAIIQIAQQAMVHNNVMDAADLNEKVEEAEKN